MSSTTGYRSLADQLRGWSDERIAALLTVRPDLGTPSPHDFGQLASRAAVRSSVARALDTLTRGELSVVDALVIARQTSVDDLASIVAAAPGYVDATLTRLRDLAIAWESPEGLRPLSAVADCLVGGPERGVSGLQPRSVPPPDPEVVADRLAALSPPARAVLDRVVAGGGTADPGSTRRTAPPVAELVGARLLVPGGADLLVVPGEVGLVLRGGRTTETPVDRAPGLATTRPSERLVASAAAGAATDFVRRTELLLDGWDRHPPAALRSGGLAVRDLRATALRLQVPEGDAALVVEVAAAAGLIATRADAAGDPVWVPTDDYDSWCEASTAARWTTLARGWLSAPRAPALVGERDADGRVRNALSPAVDAPLAVETRQMALAELAELPEGEGLAAGTGLPSLVARLAWLRPRRPSLRADQVAWTVAEAAALGVTGGDAMTAYGRCLLAGEDPTERLAAVLPAPVREVLIQSDLTAVAPGPLEPDPARSLQLLADVESAGTATVYRFTAASVRRALDAGWNADEVHAFLASVSRTPVPQALTVLVDDAVRGFGRLRVGIAASFLRSDDEALLAGLIHDARGESLELRRIAPTVLVSTVPVDVLLPRLRDLGVAAVVEGPDGVVQVGRAEPLRARPPQRRIDARSAARRSAQVAAAVRTLRANEQANAGRPASATTPAGALSALRDAVERDAAVLIGYTDHRGVLHERLVDPVRVEGGRLTAYDRTADDEREFPVHRIRSVRPADA